ncbi:MAG: DUF1579 family protein [Gemmatimonadota bacterium]
MRPPVLLLSLLAVLSAPAVAQQPANAEQRRKMEAMMAAMQPGPEHARLARLAGTWDVELTMWSPGGGEPARADAVAENEMILGGRFLQSRVKGGQPPMQIESLTLTGFDRRHGRFTTVGFDTWGTYYVTAAGGMKDSLITMHGTDEDPIAGHTQVYDMNLRFVDEDTYVTDVTFTDPVHAGTKGSFKAFEAVYRRRK